MRSRYSAYALGLDEYVLKTWAAQTRPEQLFEPGEPRPKWISLTVHESSESGDSATVTFTAKARPSRGAIVMKERSRFSRAGDTWVYVDGDQLA